MSGLHDAVLGTIRDVAFKYTARTAEGWPFKQIMGVALIRNMSSNVSIRQLRVMIPPMGPTVVIFCQKHGLAFESIPIESVGPGNYNVPTATLHKITLQSSTESDSTSQTAVFYVPGGGYVNPVAEAHVENAVLVGRAAHASHVYILEHTLAPELRYPGQLQQACSAMRWLLNTAGLAPSQIILGGHSSGGNLCLAVLAHIMQPCPGAGPAFKFATREDATFKALALISPWVALSTDAASFKRNASRDYLNEKIMHGFIAAWRPRVEVWADMPTAPGGFWTRDRIPVDKILIIAGEAECFRDDIVKFAEIIGLEQGRGDRLVEGDGEVHVQMAMATALRMPQPGTMTELIEWLQKL